MTNNYYNLEDEYYYLKSYDCETDKRTYDIKHKYKIIEMEMLYGFIPMGIAYCKENGNYVKGNLFVFTKCSEVDEPTLFDFV